MPKYTWVFYEDVEIWSNDKFDTIEECLEDAKSINIRDGLELSTCFIGKIIPFVPEVNLSSIFEQLEEDASQMAGECGAEWVSHNYRNHEELKELSITIDKALHDWLKKYNYYPEFSGIDNVKRYDFNTGELLN